MGTCPLRTSGSIFSKSGVSCDCSTGMQNARARTVMPAIIRYRGNMRTTFTIPFMSEASRGFRVARMRCMS